MERELWPLLYPILREVATDFDQKYVQIQPDVIAAVVLWAAIHDRSVAWACNPDHWDTAGNARPAQPVPLRPPADRPLRALDLGFRLHRPAREAGGVSSQRSAISGQPNRLS